MSKIEVDQITQQSGTTITVGGGACKTAVVDATTVTLGRCGGSVALASGASQTGFGRTGTVDWDTTPKTATFSAVSGDGFFCNTTGGAFTCNLPAGAAGAIVSLADYAGTWDSNALTISPNGSEKIGGVNADVELNTEGQSVTFVYVDSTQGWLNVQDSTSNERGNAFIVATGATITTCGDDRIHTFTGPGTFTVTCAAVAPANNVVDYMVVAGGGGGGGSRTGYYSGGGGGAGGFRESVPSPANWTASPIANPGNARPVTAQGYPITVGSGGAGGCGGPSSRTDGTKGSDSTFSDISSAGGGVGGRSGHPGTNNGTPGGSGGSGGGSGGYLAPACAPGGAGNTPPVSPPQGNPGGSGTIPSAGVGGGGGGATAAGTNATPGYGEPGGAGATTNISGAPFTKSTGGASGTQPGTTPTTAANSGNGGQSGGNCAVDGAAGGSGIVIIRYKYK